MKRTWDRFWIVEQFGPTRDAQELGRWTLRVLQGDRSYLGHSAHQAWLQRLDASVSDEDNEDQWRLVYTKKKTLREGMHLIGLLDAEYPARLRHCDTGQIIVR